MSEYFYFSNSIILVANYSNLPLANYSTYNYFWIGEGTPICERQSISLVRTVCWY